MGKVLHSQRLAYIQLLSVISIVLTFDILAFAFVIAFVFVQSYSQTAVIFQVLGSFFAHIFSSYFPLWFLGHRGNLLLKLRGKKSWGLLCCSFISFLAAATSLGLLGLSGLYPKFLVSSHISPLTFLTFYRGNLLFYSSQ
jgi:hypothetical protein